MESNILNKRTKGTYEVVHELNIQIKETGRPICSLGMSSSIPAEMDANKANASFICNAVNSHDALLEALHLVVGSMSLERVERFDILEKCKEAIKKAEQ